MNFFFFLTNRFTATTSKVEYLVSTTITKNCGLNIAFNDLTKWKSVSLIWNVLSKELIWHARSKELKSRCSNVYLSYIRVYRTPTNLYTVYTRIYSNYCLCSEDDVVRSDNAKQNLCRNSLL